MFCAKLVNLSWHTIFIELAHVFLCGVYSIEVEKFFEFQVVGKDHHHVLGSKEM
jgi:hypothetical protein